MTAETMGPTRFQLLEDQIRELEERVCQLEQDQCRTCTYFDFYLPQGPAELTHEEFHAAERECIRVHGELEAWSEWHQGSSAPVPLHMIRQCKASEEAVRA